MDSLLLNKTEKVIKYGIILLALVYLVSYIIMAILRIGYPFELEWMEGGSVEHVLRVLGGKDIYIAPSLEFIPYIYTPLYTWISALVSMIIGVGFFPLRLVSFVSSLVCMFFIYEIVFEETKNRFAAWFSMGLFPATFLIGGQWFDLARVDSLFLALMHVSIYILRFKKTAFWYIVSGIFAFLSFFTKQSVLIIFCFVGLFLLFENRKRSLYFILTFAILAISSTIIYNHITNGWYYFWNFTLVADHRWNKQFFLLFWSYDMFKPLSIAIAFSIILFLLKLEKKQIKDFLFYIGWAIGMFVCAWLSRLHYGGYDNVLIPAHIILIVLMGISVNEILNYFNDNKDIKTKFIRNFILLLVLGQFTTLYYNPRRYVPQQKDYNTARYFIAHLSKVKGEVYDPFNWYIAGLAGKKSYTHVMLIFDLMQSHSPWGKVIGKEFEKVLSEGKFKEIYVNDWLLNAYPEFTKYYEKKGNTFPGMEGFYTLTGFVVRPDYIYIPKRKTE